MADDVQLGEELPLEWRSIPGYAGFYEVSNDGRVRSFHQKGRSRIAAILPQRVAVPRVLRPKIHSAGYPVVCLHRPDGGKTMAYIHRLVLEAFVGPAQPGYECAHLNGIPGDARLVNLAWVNPSVNSAHRTIHGTDIGSLSLRRKAIMLLLDHGWTPEDIAKVTDSTLPQIQSADRLRQRMLAVERGRKIESVAVPADEDVRSRVHRLEQIINTMLGTSPDRNQAVAG